MFRLLRRSLPALAIVAASLAPPPAASQSAAPSPEEFLGYPLGARFTPTDQVHAYARLLDERSDLAAYSEYGITPEGRPLAHLVLARPEHAARLAEIQAAHAELADPDTPERRAREIASRNPAVVYFSYGVHGDEPSSSEAAMWTAWAMLQDSADASFVLDSLVIVIDPVANPDGRERYVGWYRSVAAAAPNPDLRSREHREPWPTGRFNHFLQDLNRDWAWGTQPETRARLAAWGRWNPLVHVDFHEMGHESSYFFFPAAAPINPLYPPHVLEWGERFGRANSAAFDAMGWAYFTGDEYDLFYPGYGDSWPSLLGAIGMTYEQAGGGEAGLAVLRRVAGDTLRLRDRAQRHLRAGLATLQAAAAGKSELMLDFATAQRAIGDAEPDVLLVPGADSLPLTQLAAHLRSQGITVERASRQFRASVQAHPGFSSRRTFPPGTMRVPGRQARGRLATTLLAPAVPMHAETSYDISAWSLPYAYGVEAHRGATPGDAGWTPAVEAAAGNPPAADAGYGYLIPGSSLAARGVVTLLREGARVHVLSRPATVGGREWAPGSWFVPQLGNRDLASRLTEVGLGALAVPLQSGRAEAGADLGSESVWTLRMPRVAVLSGEGVAPTSFGAHWFYLEQWLGLPFDALLLQDLPSVDLAGYDVLVVPDLVGTIPGSVAEAIERWVEAGGRLVAAGDGAAALAPPFEVGLRAALPTDSLPPERLLQGRSDRRRGEREREVSGAIIPLQADSAHPIAWGVAGGRDDPPLFILRSGSTVFEPSADVETVAHFPPGVEATAGVISAENLERLENGAWLVTRRAGRGSITLFADDPLFRLFWRRSHPLFLNAILVGPRH